MKQAWQAANIAYAKCARKYAVYVMEAAACRLTKRISHTFCSNNEICTTINI